MVFTQDTFIMAELSSSAPSGTPRFASRVWEMLTAPHPKIVRAAHRRRAYIASAVLLALIFCMGVFIVLVTAPSTLVPFAMVVAAYGLSRTRYFGQAVLLACAAFILAVLWTMMRVPDWSTSSPLGYLAWLIVPVLLSALLLSPRTTLLLAVAMNALILLMRPLFLPMIPAATFGVAGGFVIMISALITLATYLQQYYFVRPQLQEIQSARHELELKNAALEKANREIRDFSYIIAHDLRSPVVSVKEFVREARYAVEALAPAVDPSKVSTQERPVLHAALLTDLPEALGYIDSSAERMERLINEILRIARVGQHEVNCRHVNVDALVAKLLAHFRGTHPEIRFITRNLPEATLTDPFIVEEALSNLIDNAIKYGSAKRPQEIIILGEIQNNEAVIEVADNGRGISPSEFASVLQPFRRAGNVQGTIGTGIGLYYVRSLLERLGGRLWFTSELDVGSRFYIGIPLLGEKV